MDAIINKIVGIALTYDDAFIFGEYVREFILRGTEPTDMKEGITIRIKTSKDLNHITHLLKVIFRNDCVVLKNIQDDYNNYLGEMLYIVRMLIHSIPVSVLLICNERYNYRNVLPNWSHLTCDAFCLDNKSIHLCCDVPMNEHQSNFILHCLEHIRNKEFQHIPLTNHFENNPVLYKMESIHTLEYIKTLLNSGWTMKPNAGAFCIHTPNEVIECSICLQNITSDNQMLTTICSHKFHLQCIDLFLKKSESKVCCPCCRLEKFII
jgi:hypothetical protein